MIKMLMLYPKKAKRLKSNVSP